MKIWAKTASGTYVWLPDGPSFIWTFGNGSGELIFSNEEMDAPDRFAIVIPVKYGSIVDRGSNGDVKVNGALKLPGEIRCIQDPDARRIAWKAYCDSRL